MAGPTGVVVSETLMAPETASAAIDHTPVIHDLLTVSVDGRRRPRKLHGLVRDADANLEYPPLLLVAVNGDEEGLDLVFVGPLWHLGSDGVGPMIDDREYVSGADKLDNGSFDLDGLYWRRASEGGLWVLLAGNATNVGGLGKDDVLESERKFPTRPGHAYRMRAEGVTGTGRLRLRTIYDGRFNPPNLLADWLTPDALTIGIIPKPQLFDFAAGPAVLGPTMTFAGGALTAGPNPRPTYNADPGFETGTGWTDEIGPPSRPMSDDIDIVNDPGNAAAGDYVMTVGPITQHQELTNADFGDGLDYWHSSSTDSDPHAVWDVVVGGGNNGSDGVRTTGWSTAARTGPETTKYLRADSENGSGAAAYEVAPGETYRVEAYLRGHPGTDGRASVSIMIPHPTVPDHDQWRHSEELEAPPNDVEQWVAVSIESVNIPSNRFDLNVLCQVWDHSLGYWDLDTLTVTRTRGNRAQINSDATYTVVPGTRYNLIALMRSGGEMQVGSVRVGVILTGAGVETRIVDVDRGSTDYEWTDVDVDFTPEDGYTTVRPFVAGLDIIGEPAYIDNVDLIKMSNNTDTSTWAPVAVVADQRYQFQTDVEVLGATEGSLTVGVKLTGPAVNPEYVPLKFDVKDNAGVNSLHTDVRPAVGYTEATLYVQSTDVIGGTFRVSRATLTKMDNNTAETVGSTLDVTPERSYKWSQLAMSGANLQRGTVTLSARCKRAGYDDVVFPSAAMEATEAARKVLEFTFTPPSGYSQVETSVIGTDVEGDSWTVGSGELRDTDTATQVYDTTMDSPVAAAANVDTVAPEGAEFVRVAVIAEQGTTGWTVGSVSLARTGVTPATGNAIVADLLTDPETGDPLSIVAGAVTCPEVIPYDWVVQNMTNRDALDHYCNVVSEPTREYRVLATDPPSIDVGTRAAVFTTHDPADALLPEDVDVEALSNPETNVEGRATEIEVIGAEVQTVSGRPFLITAKSAVPGPVEYDYNNRPIVRTKQVHAGTVDHRGYAQALADDLALRESEPALALNVKLSGIDTRPDSPPGDTIHVFEPEAGLSDPDNPVTIEGATVFPRAVRVLARERSLGPSYSITMRRSDGSTFDLPGVRWADEDATVLTVGDRLPEWISDPQGKAPGLDFLAWRAQVPR